MEIIDNFMPKDKFDDLASHLMSYDFPWFLGTEGNYSKDCPNVLEPAYFVHNLIYYDHKTHTHKKSYEYEKVIPFLEMLTPKEMYRAKSNLFIGTEVLTQYTFHCDQPFKHKGAILYLNDCDGYTVFPDGTKVESIANRCLFFDSSKLHASTNCTNTHARFNINVNYN